MNCAKCGKILYEASKFCPNCGNPVEQPKEDSFCGVCGTRLGFSMQFCPGCGTKIGNMTQHVTNIESNVSGKLISEFYLVSMYIGTPNIGCARATGTLTIYDNRIEFKKQLGNALGGAFGLAGLATARSKIKKDSIEIFPISQIRKLRVGKYAGIYNTLVLDLEDNTSVSFCPALPGSSEPQKIIDSMQVHVQ